MFGEEIIIWNPVLPRCDCEQATAYWQEQDRQAAEAARQEEEAKRRRAMRQRVENLLGQSGIKKRFRQRTFPNFRTDTPGRKKNYGIAKEYADNWAYHQAKGDGLYIEGTNGTGKTHLAAAIALQLIHEGVPVICKTSSDLLLDIKKSFDGDGIRESDVLDIYKRVDLLIIDDLGKEQCSDWSMSTLYSILNDRYEDMKPTIVTTNYNQAALAAALRGQTPLQALVLGLAGAAGNIAWAALTATAAAGIVLTIESKWDRRLWKGLCTYWLFLLTWLPITAVSFWKKTTVWEEIRHTRTMAPQLPGR